MNTDVYMQVKNKYSQQICPLSANEWEGGGVQPPKRIKLNLLWVKLKIRKEGGGGK